MSNTPTIPTKSRTGKAGLDGRTVNARRVRVLVVTFTNALGGAQTLDALQREHVLKAAQLTVAAEDLRECSLRGEPVDVSNLVKLENLASRAVRTLDWGMRARKATSITLRDHLARRAQAGALTEAAK